jgi:hypothetical protein
MRYPTDSYASSFDSKKIVLVDQSGSSSSKKRRFTTIKDGLANAEAGDTVLVMPGLYNERIQAKDKVNIHFMNGAVVHYTGTEIGPLIYDSYYSQLNFGVIVKKGNMVPIEWSVTGDGIFIQDSQPPLVSFPTADMATVCVFSEGKRIHVSGKRFIDICTTSPNNASLLFYDGNLTFHASEYMQTPYDAILSLVQTEPGNVLSTCHVTTPLAIGGDNCIEWGHPGTLYANIDKLVGVSDILDGNAYIQYLEAEAIFPDGGSAYVISPTAI